MRSAGDLIAPGVRQRVLAVEAFLADVYGPGRVFDDGVLPWRLLYTAGGFRREAAGFAPPNGVRVHVASVDLTRDDQGGFRVLGQNVRAPAGLGHLIGDRARAYTSRLLAALRAAAPHAPDPQVVVLTAGVRGPAYREHAALARRLGVPLVEGRDLSCRRDRVYANTGHAARPVDVLYRHVADGWLDPLALRAESRLGCPGLVNAARAGQVTIANAVGNGIADDPRVCVRVPDLIRYYLGQEPLLANAESLRDRPLRAYAVNDGDEVRVLPGPAAGERV
ncbi:MAG TPA: circularly permuted type 2 ATP-grasp protein [Trebonia sp.]|nr:circularly permuted type 2 ATP-grasp protein [Trebonia sp.]